MSLLSFLQKRFFSDQRVSSADNLAELREVVELYKNIHNCSFLNIFIYNLKYFLSYSVGLGLSKISYFTRKPLLKTKLNSHGRNMINQYKFYRLLYSMEKHRIYSAKENLYQLLIDTINNNHENPQKIIDRINKIIAGYIVVNSKDFNKYQLIKIKNYYYKWVDSLGEENSSKYFLTKFIETRTHKYSLLFKEQAVDSEVFRNKPVNLKKKYFKILSVVIIIGTSIALGLIPAVLASGSVGSVIFSLLTIGIPSIIINLIIYNHSVQNFVQDLMNGRLLRDDNGKFVSLAIPLFIISAAAGIVYASMVFVTSFIACTALAFSLIPSVIIKGLPSFVFGLACLSAISLAFTAMISTTALYFSSLVDVARKGVIKEFFGFIKEKFLLVINSNKTLQQKSILLIIKSLFYLSLLVSSFYLTFVETALLYSMTISLIPIVPVALCLVILTAPVNLLFTFKIYSFSTNLILSIPSFCNNVKDNIKSIFANPIILYEAIKTSLKLLVMSLFIADYAKGSATGLVDEVSTVNFFGINLHMNNSLVSGFTKFTEAGDCVGVCLEGAHDTYEPTVASLILASIPSDVKECEFSANHRFKPV